MSRVRGHSASTWAWAIPVYLTAMQAAGRASGTVRLHHHYLGLLRERHRHPWSVSTAQLQQLLANPSWGAETRKSARQVYRGFYRWAHGERLIEDDPAVRLLAVRVPLGVARPAPQLLVEKLLRHPDDRIGFMVLLAAHGGLRAGEIARVHQRDVLDDDLLVHGKGGRVRAIPLVDERLAWRLSRVEGWAFPNGLGSHLSPGHVSRLLSREMPAGWTAHTLRHRYGTNAYAGTRDLIAVKQLLGHSRSETTERYVQLPDDALRKAARAALGAA